MKYFKTLSLAAAVLIACGASCTAPDSAPSGSMPLAGRWTLVSFNGSSVPSGQSIAFETDNRYTAKFCNSMGGSYMFANNVFVSTSTMSTLMACTDQRMTIEEAFSKNLANGLTLTMTSSALQLRGNDGSLFDFTRDQTTGTTQNTNTGTSSAATSTLSMYKTISRPDDFSLQYPTFMEAELGKELSATLPNSSVAKIYLPKSYFNPNDINNFQEAFLVFSATTSNKVDKDDFMAFTDIPSVKPSAAAVQFNGYNFSFTTTSDAGAGNFYRTELYRTVQNGNYYQAEITVHTTNAANYTPARQEFTGDAYAPLRDVLRTINFLR